MLTTFATIVLVCEGGTSTPTGVAVLLYRLSNTPINELTAAAAQQMLITEKRLRELWTRKEHAPSESRQQSMDDAKASVSTATRRTGAQILAQISLEYVSSCSYLSLLQFQRCEQVNTQLRVVRAHICFRVSIEQPACEHSFRVFEVRICGAGALLAHLMPVRHVPGTCCGQRPIIARRVVPDRMNTT